MTCNIYGLVKAAGLIEEKPSGESEFSKNIGNGMNWLKEKLMGLFGGAPGNALGRDGVHPDLQKQIEANQHAASRIIPGDMSSGFETRMVNGVPVTVPNNLLEIMKARQAAQQG